jgi:F-type H+-transporting ATPase subunit epsilon
MPQLQCVVVTPEVTVVDMPVDFVVLPLYDGEIGVAPGHSPMIGRLGYGEMRLRSGKQTSHYYVDGGFVQVADNVVSVLTGRAIPADQLNASEITEKLAEARGLKANAPELLEIRDRNVTQRRAQLRIARKHAVEA